MKYWLLLGALWLGYALQAQTPESFSLALEEISVKQSPGLQSFVVGQDEQGRWLFIGGRTDGLHLRRPFESFLASDNNLNFFVVDPIADTTYSTSISSLSTDLAEQLQSTNMEFYQRDDRLYIIGGYAYSATAADHITFPFLTAVDVPRTVDAIIKGTSIAPYIQQISDPRMQVTGGYLGYLDSVFYLVGGQKFMGRYNPMGPTHGPGFTQEYTNAIRTFKIIDNGTSIAIADFQETVDSANLHRRDYNMTPQIFPDGTAGFTAFSGVFQYTADLPWLNTVDITAKGYQVRPNFNQYLSQYHSAHVPIFDAQANAMHTLFFGGMSRYTLDPVNGQLVDDQNVPFVKTISQVTRYANDSMVELTLPISMPGFLGSSAEFIPRHDIAFLHGEILDLNQLPQGRTLIGYIYGGIESTAPNIFFVNDGTQSEATNRCFEVYLEKGTTTALPPVPLTGDQVIGLELAPNPADSQVKLTFWIPDPMNMQLLVHNVEGKIMTNQAFGQLGTGTYQQQIDCSAWPAGMYWVTLQSGDMRKTVSFVRQ